MYYIVHNKHDKDSRAFVEAHGEGKMIIDFYDHADPQTIMFQASGIGISDFPSMVDIAKRIVSTKPADYEAGCAEIEGIDLNNILKTRKKQVNYNTARIIESGFLVSDKRMSMKPEDQAMLQALLQQKDSLSYPAQVKGSSEYISLANASEVSALCTQASQFLLDTLASGYELKQALDEMDYAQLLAFTDVR